MPQREEFQAILFVGQCFEGCAEEKQRLHLGKVISAKSLALHGLHFDRSQDVSGSRGHCTSDTDAAEELG